MGKKLKHSQKSHNSIISQQQFVEVKRRAKLICDALDTENDAKVEEIAIESIKFMTPPELVMLGDQIEKHGYYAVGEAITDGDLYFFEENDDEYEN